MTDELEVDVYSVFERFVILVGGWLACYLMHANSNVFGGNSGMRGFLDVPHVLKVSCLVCGYECVEWIIC